MLLSRWRINSGLEAMTRRALWQDIKLRRDNVEFAYHQVNLKMRKRILWLRRANVPVLSETFISNASKRGWKARWYRRTIKQVNPTFGSHFHANCAIHASPVNQQRFSCCNVWTIEVYTYPNGESTPLVDIDKPDTSYILFEIFERDAQNHGSRVRGTGNPRNSNPENEFCGYHILLLPPNQDVKLVSVKHYRFLSIHRVEERIVIFDSMISRSLVTTRLFMNGMALFTCAITIQSSGLSYYCKVVIPLTRTCQSWCRSAVPNSSFTWRSGQEMMIIAWKM
jgi:hypothetical protein